MAVRERWESPYHEGERSGRQGPVVVNTVPHTHLHLSLLHPVAGGVIQQTHDPAGDKVGGGQKQNNGRRGQLLSHSCLHLIGDVRDSAATSFFFFFL